MRRGWYRDNYRHYLAAKYGKATRTPVLNPNYHKTGHPYKPIMMFDETAKGSRFATPEYKKQEALAAAMIEAEGSFGELSPQMREQIKADVYSKFDKDFAKEVPEEVSENTPQFIQVSSEVDLAAEDAKVERKPWAIPKFKVTIVGDSKAAGIDELQLSNPGVSKKDIEKYVEDRDSVKVNIPDLPSLPTKKEWYEQAERFKAAPEELKKSWAEAAREAKPYIKTEKGRIVLPAAEKRAERIANVVGKEWKSGAEQAKRKTGPFVKPYARAAEAELSVVKSPQEVEESWLHRASVAVRGVLPTKISEWEVRNLAARTKDIDAKEIQLNRALRDELRRQQVMNLGSAAQVAPVSIYKRKIADLEAERAKLNAAVSKQYVLARIGAKIK